MLGYKTGYKVQNVLLDQFLINNLIRKSHIFGLKTIKKVAALSDLQEV